MRVIIDCDPGNGVPGADVDDGLAIGLAVRSPEVELEAISVVAGNVPVDRGVECALEVLDAAGRPDIPVYRGAARPLVADPRPWRTQLDRRRDDPTAQVMWRDGPPKPSDRVATPGSAAQELVQRVDASPGEITVVAIGPLTNVATAMLLDPDWAAKVAGLVVMGGAFDVPDLLQELNASYDPEATHLVLTSVAPLLVVPLDVTLRTFLHLDEVDRLDDAGTQLATYLAHTARPWVSWLADRFGLEGCPLHDPLALAALLRPEVITTRQACVDIELRGSLTRGRTVAWEPGDLHSMSAGLDLPTVRHVSIADGVDNDSFVPFLIERLTA